MLSIYNHLVGCGCASGEACLLVCGKIKKNKGGSEWPVIGSFYGSFSLQAHYWQSWCPARLRHKATAKVDSRLPPGLEPEEALAKIRAHLDANGFIDIEMRVLSPYPAEI